MGYFILSVIFFGAIMVYKEIKVQSDFERIVVTDWNAMSDEEKAASGREDMWC